MAPPAVLRAAARPLVAVLGLGEMGLIHARALARSRGIRLGLASARPDVLAATAADLYADRVYSSHAEALADPELAGVVIATPPPAHPAGIAAAVDAGIGAILCEKPLGFGVAEVKGAVDSIGCRFMTGFQRRWDAGYLKGKRAVESGAIGAGVVLKCTSGDASYPEKYVKGGAAAGQSHSMLRDLAVHDVDLARWLLQSEVRRVYVTGGAMTYPRLAEFGDTDVVVAVLEMESGAKAVLHLSRAFDYGYNVTTELVGVKGSIQMGVLEETAARVLEKGEAKTEIAPAFPERFKPAFEAQADAFVRLVTAKDDAEAERVFNGSSSYAGAVDGLRVTEVAEAMVKSIDSGLVVDVERNE